jgi:two-component system cell cycle response regulator
MPGMHGPEVCRQLREQASERYQYVLLLTSKDTTDDIVAGLESGADDYLTKPFEVDELLARLRVGTRIIKLQDRLLSTQEALRFQATHDPLTGVWNHGALLELVRAEVDRCRRKSTSLSLFMIDIDHFKRVNDDFGHLAGDAVLREVAQRLDAAVRTYDVLGRCGGEEFMVVSSELTYERPYQFADRLRTAVCSSPFRTPQSGVEVSISVGGVTAQPDASCSVEKLIHGADTALYAAKRNGRNRVEMASPELA